MRRAAIEKQRTLQVWRRHLVTHSFKLVCECELQPGRFRKSQRVVGCGRPRCWLWHYDKLAGIPTPRHLRSTAAEREGLADVPTNPRINPDPEPHPTKWTARPNAFDFLKDKYWVGSMHTARSAKTRISPLKGRSCQRLAQCVSY